MLRHNTGTISRLQINKTSHNIVRHKYTLYLAELQKEKINFYTQQMLEADAE
jgi:hypothetical protein